MSRNRKLNFGQDTLTGCVLRPVEPPKIKGMACVAEWLVRRGKDDWKLLFYSEPD